MATLRRSQPKALPATRPPLRLAILALVALLLLATPLQTLLAQCDAADSAAPTQTAKVAGVEDGSTLTLDDGRQLRLIAIEAPGVSANKSRASAFGNRAAAALSALATGRTVELCFSGPPSDRYGRLLAQARRVDGLWLGEAMVRQGLARVVPLPQSRLLLDELLSAENAARDANLGIWSRGAYAVRTPADLRAGTGDFIIVEGRVADVVQGKERLSLGLVDAREPAGGGPPDAAATLARVPGPEPRAARIEIILPTVVSDEFAAAGVTVVAAVGWTVRARGWLERRSGTAQIVLQQREQLEFTASPG